jgi:segregation and condensation protein B
VSEKPELEKIDFEKITALVEAVLYLHSDSLDEAAISRILNISKEEVIAALEKIEERYSSTTDCGLGLSRIGGGIMISVKRDLWENEILKERYGKKNEAKISRAAMETLAIVAHSQPVTRAEIEKIRGVSADNMIRLLLEKGLVKESGKKDIPGRPVMYGTTKEFLRVFSLNSIADLPKLGESDIEKFALEGEKY